jgi:hypothetical protein
MKVELIPHLYIWLVFGFSTPIELLHPVWISASSNFSAFASSEYSSAEGAECFFQ